MKLAVFLEAVWAPLGSCRATGENDILGQNQSSGSAEWNGDNLRTVRGLSQTTKWTKRRSTEENSS